MAIKPPNWKKDAVPSLRGWRHPRTGELLKAKGLTQAEVSEYLGAGTAHVEDPMEHTHPDGTSHSHEGGHMTHTHDEPEMLMEAPASGGLSNMSKRELEALGRQHDIELDRRKSKSVLIEELEEAGVHA